MDGFQLVPSTVSKRSLVHASGALCSEHCRVEPRGQLGRQVAGWAPFLKLIIEQFGSAHAIPSFAQPCSPIVVSCSSYAVIPGNVRSIGRSCGFCFDCNRQSYSNSMLRHCRLEYVHDNVDAMSVYIRSLCVSLNQLDSFAVSC